MKAVMKVRPEPGIEIREIERPKLPKNYPSGEVIVRVEACGVCGTDIGVYDWSKWIAQYMQIPRVIGHEIAGTIVEVYDDTGLWKVGDRIVSDTFLGCGKCYYCLIGKFNICANRASIGLNIDGGMAEYVAIPTINLFKLQDDISFIEGAAIEPLGVAMHGFEQSGFIAGDRILILGCGPIGLCVLMIANRSGASKLIITGVELDTLRLKKAEELGADLALKAERKGCKEIILQETNMRGADVVFVCAGSNGVLSQALETVRPGGTIVVLGIFHKDECLDTNIVVERELTIRGSFRRAPETWFRMLNLLEKKQLPLKNIITHTLPLNEIENAFQLLKKGEAIKVVVIP
jgi:2-desacetyl-2-hydroxyethyl bacteriochlorophyllide A dehydrogenase